MRRFFGERKGMAYLIGTDEAGYGPNLGPLVIAATAWRVPDEALRHDLYNTLAETVCSSPARGGTDLRIPIADSKQLYQPGGGLDRLELGVGTALRRLRREASCWRELWPAFDGAGAAAVAAVPWHAGYDLPLPCAVPATRLDRCAAVFAEGLERASIELVDARATVVFPERWNEWLDRHESKGAALSHGTLQLVRELFDSLAPAPALVVCDKHGGRNRYGPLLQHFFPEVFVEAHGEGRAASVYRWGPPGQRVEIQFVARGESFLPSALASMIAKYLRELAMLAFNHFWTQRQPGLKPTAGYPVDAARFRAEIATLQQSLGIADRQLWRNK